MISALVFLIVGGALVGTLLKGIVTLISTDFEKEGFSGGKIFSIFKIPLICFVVLMVYIIVILPYLNANGFGN